MPDNDLAAAVERLRRVQNGERLSAVYHYTCRDQCDYDHVQTLHDIDRNAVANAYLAREADDAKPKRYDTDWNGRPIREDEQPDDIVECWEIEPYMGSDNEGYTSMVLRSWHQLIDRIGHDIEMYLDGLDADDLREGVTVKFRLVRVTRSQWDEITDRD